MPSFIERLGAFFRSGSDPDVPATFGLGLHEVLEEANQRPGGFLTGLFRQEAAPRRGDDELLDLYRDGPWLRAAAYKVGLGVGSLEWSVYARRGPPSPDGRQHFIRDYSLQRSKNPARRRRVKRQGLRTGDLVEFVDHPLLDLLEEPCPVMTGVDMFQIGQTHVDIVGETFIVIEPNALRVPGRLWITPPTWVTHTPIVGREWYEIHTPDGRQHQLHPAFVIHIKDPNPAEPYRRGIGLGRALADELDVDEYASKHVSSWFNNSAVPSMLIALEGAKPAVVERAKRQWDNALRGYLKSYRTHWTNQKLSAQRLDTHFKDMDLVNIREFERDAVVTVFGIPPEKLGIVENSNRATIDAADYIFAKDVIVPRAERWRRILQQHLVPLYDDTIVIDYASPVEEDRQFHLAVTQAHPAAFTVDEIRDLADHDPVGDERGGNGYLVPPGTEWARSLTVLEGRGAALPPSPSFFSTDRALPAVARSITLQDIRTIIQEVLAEDMTEVTQPVVEKLMQEFGQDTAEAIQNGSRFEMDTPEMREHVHEYVRQRIDLLVNNTTRSRLQQAMTAALVEEGTDDSVVEAARDVFREAEVTRSGVIAETEVRRSSQFAGLQAMKQAELGVVREWVATLDGRARNEHEDLDGQQREVDEPFEIPSGQYRGARTMFPGGFGIAAMDVRCRCVSVPVVLDEGERSSDPRVQRVLATGLFVSRTMNPAERRRVWRKLDDVLRTWDRELEKALQVGFARQRDRVLARIDDLSGDRVPSPASI